jgi:hypothetical protein
MDAYYAEDSTRQGKLWAPPTGKAGGEAAVKAPILLTIPLELFQVIWDKKRALMPHDIHALTVAIVTNLPDVEKARADLELVLSWCLMALQMNTSGNSHLSLAVETVTEGDDNYFVRWIDQRLNSTFGPRTGKGSTGHNDRGRVALLAHDQAQVLAIMASEVGKGVAMGLQAAGHLHRDATNIGGGYDSEGGKGYTKDNITALMGFTGVYSSNNLPDIWELFNSTKGKNIDAYRRHIYSRMKQYAYNWRIQIDTSVYLEQETIKVIVKLRFNPGGGVAYLSLALKGLSILACRACTMQETKQVHKQEQALSATEKTRLLDNLLKLPKVTMRAPADNFWELKMNVLTFMALVWVLFGSQCDYYKSLQQIYKTLELKEVYAFKASFTAENCRRITWAILDDGRAFFNNVKTTINFTGQDITFPQLYLVNILNNIRCVVLVEWASFPNEWCRRDCTQDKKGTTKPFGGQGARERSNDTYIGQHGHHGRGGIDSNRPTSLGSNTHGGQAYTNNAPHRGGSLQDWKLGWVDTRNQKIKALMDPYLEHFNGRIHLNEVLDEAGKRQTDLPMLPWFCYANGRPVLCWNSTLGCCMYRDCCYLRKGSYPGQNDIPGDFADKVCAVIRPGIQARMQPGGGEGSPGKKIKLEPAAQA